jgi:hypothetical protein
MSDEPEDIGRESESGKVDQAFIESHNHALGDLRLEPYSPARIIAAQAMGLHYGSIDAAGMAQFNKTKVYPGAIRDIAVVLWLCSIRDESEIDAAARDPVGAAKKMQTWSARLGILDTGNAAFWDAYVLFFKIMNDIQASRVQPEKKTVAKRSGRKK